MITKNRHIFCAPQMPRLGWYATGGIEALLLFALMISSTMTFGQMNHRKFALEAEDAHFGSLVDKESKISKLASGFGFTEGPVWDEAGFLWVSDETLNKLFKIDANTGKIQQIIAIGDPDGNTYDQRHRLLVCASVSRAILRLLPDGHSFETIANRYQGKRFNSPNDIVGGPDGALYFTDPTSNLPAGQKAELAFKGVYRISVDGHVRLLIKDLEEPNGLAFSPDGKKLYVDDSKTKAIWVYDFLPSGDLKNGRVFANEPGRAEDGVPDGMRLDRAGNLFVVGPRGIWVWDSNGHHLGTIVVPEQPANLAWGDPDYSTLYITATTSVYRLHTRTHGFVPYALEAGATK